MQSLQWVIDRMRSCGAARYDFYVAATITVVVLAEFMALTVFAGLGQLPVQGGDGPTYDALATNLLDYGSFSLDPLKPDEPTVTRTPGYPGLLVLIYGLAGRSAFAVRAVQFLLLVVGAWALYRASIHLVGRPASAVAGVLFATYQPFVFMATFHLTETMATCLACVTAWVVVTAGRTPGLYLGAGSLLGLLALTRPSFAFFPFVLIGAVLLGFRPLPFRQRIRAGVYILAGFSVVVLPWTARNYAVSGRLVPLGTGSGWGLYLSAQQYTGEISYRVDRDEWRSIIAEYDARQRRGRSTAQAETGWPSAYPVSVRAELEVDREFTVDAAEKFRSARPTTVLRSVPIRIAYLWSPADFSPWTTGAYHRFVQGWHIALVAFAVLGLWICNRRQPAYFVFLAFPVYLTALHLVFHIEPRYSFPARPFVLAFAAAGMFRCFRWVASRGRQHAPTTRAPADRPNTPCPSGDSNKPPKPNGAR
jgi:4-amino-4-deoxy-L-arabinose transferase-like glycosyltransferase